MKKLIIFVSILLLVSCNYRYNYKYMVKYTDGIKKKCDYTDEITLISADCITYLDEKGNELVRCGTFSVIKLKE